MTHTDLCLRAIRRGIHVLCEKPLAIEYEPADRIVRAAVEQEVLFTMASKFRHVSAVTAAKSLVTSGVLGEIVLFENTFTAHVDMSSRWNSDPRVSGGGVLIDNGTHSVDIIRYFLGPLRELQAVEGKRIQDLPVEDTVRMFVRTQTDVMATIDLSWSINKQQPYYISLYGTNGTAHIGWQESVYRRREDREWTVFGQGYDKLQAFRGQIDNFSGAIRGDQKLIITAADALASVRVIEVAYEALRRDAWVPISDGLPVHAYPHR